MIEKSPDTRGSDERFALAGLEALPDPVIRVDSVPDLGVVAQAGLDRSWYRIAGRQRPAPLHPVADEGLPVRVALTRDPACEVLSHRPRRRLVLRRRAPTGVVVETGLAPGRLRLAMSRHRVATSALAGTPLRGPRLVASAPERESFIVQDLDGGRPPIHPSSAEIFRMVGLGLRRLQEVQPVACLPVLGVADLLAEIDGLAAKVADLTGALPDGWSSCRAEVGHLMQRLGESSPVLCLRHLHDRHIAVSDQRVGVLDFSGLCLADPALDPGHLLAHLELRVLQGVDGSDAESLARLSSAFMQGWGREIQVAQERLRAHRAVSLARLALEYSLRPRWRRIVPGLMRRCERWLGEPARHAQTSSR